jgi:monofunctional glycosyltransferase
MKILTRVKARFWDLFSPGYRRRRLSRFLLSREARPKAARQSLPPILIRALVLGEDRRFYTHSGIDVLSVVSAPWRLVRRRKISGASTIEQQLVRVLTGDKSRSLARKLREMRLARILDMLYTKSEIAEIYMAVAYFGWNMNGIDQACRRLSIDLSCMTPRQAAGLVARLKYPEPRVASQQRDRCIARRTEYLLTLLSPIEPTVVERLPSKAAFLDN